MFVIAIIAQCINMFEHFAFSLYDGTVNLKNIEKQENEDRGKLHENFYTALTQPQKEIFKTEEDFLREKYNIERITPELLDRMMNTKPGKKVIT